MYYCMLPCLIFLDGELSDDATLLAWMVMHLNSFTFVVCLVFKSNLSTNPWQRGYIIPRVVKVTKILEWTSVTPNELEILILQISFSLKEPRSLGQLKLGFGVVLSDLFQIKMQQWVVLCNILICAGKDHFITPINHFMQWSPV